MRRARLALLFMSLEAFLMNEWRCEGCRKLFPLRALKSRCMMQLKTNAWNGFCIDCCCLNSIRRVECDDPSGFGWRR